MDDVGPSGRLRQAATILVFDLGGPLLAYALLRSAGFSAVAALVIGARPGGDWYAGNLDGVLRP